MMGKKTGTSKRFYSRVFCSLVIPCYNEEKNIDGLVNGFVNLPAEKRKSFELILVDNGSRDRSLRKLKYYSAKYSFIRYVVVPANQGYGWGITQGLRCARGRYIGWAHGDLQYDPAQIMDAVGLLRLMVDEASGKGVSRKFFFKGLRRNRSFAEAALTFCMSVTESLIFLKPMRDINAQPTIFNRSLLYSWKAAPKNFSLDLFAYYAARKMNFIVRRSVMDTHPRSSGKSSWNSGWRSRWNLIKIYISDSFKIKRNLKKLAADARENNKFSR